MEGSMERWLAFAGFSGNPFDVHEAGKEKHLPRYFVPSLCFDDIVGDPTCPGSAVVFAARGCGKTTKRIMIQHLCHTGHIGRGRVLAIPYTDFEPLAALHSGPLPQDTVRSHVLEILHHAVASLVEDLFHDERVFVRYCELSRWEKIHVHWFLYTFGRELSPFQRSELIRIGIKRPTAHPTSDQDDLNEAMLNQVEDKAHANPTYLMRLLSRLLNGLGYDTFYVLIDGVDELAATASDTESAIQLMSPFLKQLSLLDMPGMAFKFFLPLEWSEVLINRGAIRRDRLRVRYVDWTPDQLGEMLHRRLAAFRGRSDMNDLLEPDLADCIEAEMVRLALGSPRNLMRLGNFLFSEHCARFNGAAQRKIPMTVWESAKSRFLETRDLVCAENNDRNSLQNSGYNPFFPPC
jgi:hypothetical protein